jgi:FkbM family methyltransferase
MKEAVKHLACALYGALLPDEQARKLAFAHRLRRLFAQYRIDTVIDVGANLGQFRDFLRNGVGFKGHIDSFEPLPELCEQLKIRAAKDKNWTVHPCALGAEVGHTSINVTELSVFSSIRTPKKTGSPQDQMNTVVKKLTVPISTLDAQYSKKRDLSHAYLKLDTQGFDLEVVAGGSQKLAEIPLLQTEVSIRPFYEEMPTYIESIKAFEKRGFAIADLFLVSSDDKKRAMEFDCVMVRAN